jgi:CheY-like chemotaxis protein
MKKIFLLEDDFSLNESIKEMLEESGFVVDTFYNGQKAFDNIFGNYMLYIFDINVPNIDGITLLEKVKSMNPSAKVIIISARVYEYIVLSDILSYCENKEEILKSHYKALENSGNIIILEKISNNNKDEVLELLENSGFQAGNCIELFDDVLIFTAKKMHNWDNGL